MDWLLALLRAQRLAALAGFAGLARLGGLLLRLAAPDYLPRLLAGPRKLQDRVLEELHHAEHRGLLARVQRLGAQQQLVAALGVVHLGKVFAARLVQHELHAELGHSPLSWHR